jgi:predicted ATPase/class 3 adenylate cyclase
LARPPRLPSGTITFLLTDVEGSTRLWESDAQRMAADLQRHDAVLAQAISGRDGTVVKSRGEGDSLFAVFQRASDAVAAALDGQRSLARELPGLRVRMALHTGEAELRDHDYFGRVVNRCARVRAAAHGGQVVLTSASEQMAREDLPAGASLQPLGEHRLRDLERPEQLFQLVHPDLPDAFPRLRSLEAHRHNLPAQLTSFIGRESELDEAKAMLAGSRLLTITGIGGAGKTRLAVQLAADTIDDFEDGVWLVELDAVSSPDLVPQVVASALGLEEAAEHGLLDGLTGFLRERRILVILDNCEHLVEACAGLAVQLLRNCPGLRLVATSREVFNVTGEAVLRLQSLAESAAVRLFVDRAALSRPGFALADSNLATVTEICRRLDGIPLALELAAARVRLLPPPEILQRLDDRFRLLAGGSRATTARQQALRATVDWSYDLLDGDEKALFNRLGVFPASFTLAAAEDVCGADGADVLALLARLVDKSLVLSGEGEDEGRYRLLETLRSYGQERLRESGELAGVQRRHAASFAALAGKAATELLGPGQLEALLSLDRETDNIRAALEWARDTGDELLVALAAALVDFWSLKSRLREGRAWVEAALSRSPVDPLDRGHLQLGLARFTTELGDRASASREAAAAATLLLEAGDRRGAGRAVDLIGRISVWVGDFAEAERRAAEALKLAEGPEDPLLLAAANWTSGQLAWRLDDLPSAQSHFAGALEHARRTGAPSILGEALDSLGHIADALGDRKAARDYFEESLEIYRSVGERRLWAHALNNLGDLAVAEGQFEPARQHLCEALSLVLETGGGALRAAPLLDSLSRHAIATEHCERALGLAAAALAARQATGSPLPPAWQLDMERNLAGCREALGKVASEAAWAEGGRMSLDQATRLALDLPDSESHK